MKELKILGIVIGVLIIILISVTIVAENKITDAGERGFSEGYAQGYVAGYGFEEEISADYLVRNPTYDQVQEILAEDETHCAYEINNYAETKGIRAALVTVSTVQIRDIKLMRPWSVILVAFETVDKGLIFIEPGSHKEVKVEIGKRFSELNRWFRLLPGDDTITKITIVW